MIICLLIPLGAVSASDINNTADDQVLSATPSVDTLSASVNPENNNDTLSVNDENLLSAGLDSGSNDSILKISNDNLLKDDGTEALDFNSLNSVIRLSTDGYKLLTDYYYNNQPIVISKSNFILDGNYKTLDGKGNTVFQITGNNVTLKNLNIINTQVNNWDGDNGKLINVNITDTKITSGAGAIDWEGNNGTLNKVTFENVIHTSGDVSAASCVYFGGVDYLVENSEVINSYNSVTRALWLFDVTAVGNNIVKNCKFENISLGTRHGDGLLFARGVNLKVINMTLNNTFSASTVSFSSVIATGYMEMYNSTIDLSVNPKNTLNYHLYGGNIIRNCTFIGNDLTIPYSARGVTSSVIIDNCTFDNDGKSFELPAYSFISNSTFKNFKLGNDPLFKFDRTAGFYQLDNCTFDNNTRDGNLISMNDGNNYVFNKLTFNNNNVTGYLLNINETISANVYQDTFKYNNNNVWGNVNFTGEGFTPVDTLYVSDTPTDGDGTSRGKSISLNDALNNFPFGGKIIIINGTHTIDKATTIGCSVIGENNVVINMTNKILTLADSINITNLTILNPTYIDVGSNNNISNINISKNVSNYIFQFNGKLDVELNNILIFNSNLQNNVFSFSNSRNIPIAPRVTVNGLKLDNVKSSQYIFNLGGFLNSNLNDIEVTNSQISGIYYKRLNAQYGHNINSVDSSFDTVTVKNSNITSFLFSVSNVLDDDLEYNNIVVDTVNFTAANNAFISFGYNQVVNGLTINDLNCTGSKTMLINLGTLGHHSINNVEIHNFNKSIILFNYGDGSNFNKVVVDNVNVTQLTGNNSNPNFIGLHVKDSNFTTGTIMVLGDSNIMQDSEFDTYTGHIVVDGDNVRISGTNFTGGNNTGLNGSAIYLSNGSGQFKLINCNFNDNNASNGTVYVSADCQRPQLNDCTFNNNIAEYLGGALYIVSTQDNKVTVGINDATNSTIYYIGQSRYNYQGYNDFYGFLEDVYEVLYLINDTGDKTGSDADGKTFDTPSSDLSLLYNLLDGSKVYFVHYGDTFTPSVKDFNYESTFSDVEVYGNATTLLDMGFTVSSSSPNLKLYNITFKDYPDTAMIVNASGCLFDNCSFINVGGDNVLYGGAMQINANDTTIRNSRFINNSAVHVNTEGVSDSYGGALYVNASHFTVNDCHFEANNVSNDGAHIFIAEGQDSVVLTGNNFTKSNVVGEGSGSSVVVQGTKMKIQDNNFTENNGKQGAALSVIGDNSFLTVVNNNFTDNTASENGGALYLHFTNSMATPNTITDNDFTDNTAVKGGALYVDSLNLIGLNFTNDYVGNNATNGGAVYINCPDFELVNGIIENNSAVNGGGVYVNANDVTIRDVDFTGNNATLGGALYVDALNTNVIDSDFIANTANTSSSMGSAVYVSENGGVTLTKVTLNKNYVYGENSTSQRGDIYVDHGKFADNGITYGSEPYKQYLSNMSVLTLTIAYVSETGGGSGTAYDSPATLTEVLKLLEPNSIIYLVGDDLTFNNYTLNNLTNVTIVNYNDGKNRKIKGNDKYLFNQPKNAKNKKKLCKNISFQLIIYPPI